MLASSVRLMVANPEPPPWQLSSSIGSDTCFGVNENRSAMTGQYIRALRQDGATQPYQTQGWVYWESLEIKARHAPKDGAGFTWRNFSSLARDENRFGHIFVFRRGKARCAGKTPRRPARTKSRRRRTPASFSQDYPGETGGSPSPSVLVLEDAVLGFVFPFTSREREEQDSDQVRDGHERVAGVGGSHTTSSCVSTPTGMAMQYTMRKGICALSPKVDGAAFAVHAPAEPW